MKKLISNIDYTLLNTEATVEEIKELCRKANEFGVKSVCVRPNMVHIAKKELLKSDVLVCTVVSFPEGVDTTTEKLEETRKCIADGADEIDMVLNYKKMILPSLGFYHPSLVNDVETLVRECHRHTNKDDEKITLKVIVESSMLDEYETRDATKICIQAGADFIKTSTGYAPNNIGAELHKIQTMKKMINEAHSHMKIKASGGIRTLEDLQKFEPYVDRFGVGCVAVDNIFSNKEKINDTY